MFVPRNVALIYAAFKTSLYHFCRTVEWNGDLKKKQTVLAVFFPCISGCVK